MRNNLSTGDLIYLGNPDDAVRFDGAFRVLNPKLCNTGEIGIFLLSENLIGKNQTSGYPIKNVPDPIHNSYVDSAARNGVKHSTKSISRRLKRRLSCQQTSRTISM